ncbi:hypothetical protein GQ55_9G338200 [Panicum hallii var. hallii]|uniref:Acyl-[acyl-carrier-protein] desaturase n=1 Tax=Panicum hallii var. hallii TaxID=1504633 RepID=A0A2T7C8M6_9POAL|nr:hypothetical protein GQ55_9G338200 [Panicum hallii var. hallii]
MALTAATLFRCGGYYPSCKPNAPAGGYRPPTKAAAAAAGAGNGNGVLAINRSSRRCRSTATASRESMAGRRQEMKDIVDEEEWRSYLAPERLEVLREIEPWVEENVLPLLKPVEASWQPSDLLPDPAALGSDGFHAACLELRKRAAGVPDELLVCLVANMVTEEALPMYPSGLNRLEVVRDTTGADATAWARWIRGWSAEENRHGDVLNRYMHLSGRFDMREVERTVQRLIRDGMTVHAPASPFHGFAYVAFQERATAIAHGNTARLVGARGAGDAALARICGTVAADEKRHEAAYTRIMGKLFEADPDAAVRAMAYMMRRRIDMPTAFINDGRHSSGDFYARFIAIAEKAGTYTLSDYRCILEHLMRQWRVEELTAGLSSDGRHAQDYLCALPHKIKRMEEKAHDRVVKAKKKPTLIPINWIFDRPISVVVP